jgi:hypothetical protein
MVFTLAQRANDKLSLTFHPLNIQARLVVHDDHTILIFHQVFDATQLAFDVTSFITEPDSEDQIEEVGWWDLFKIETYKLAE